MNEAVIIDAMTMREMDGVSRFCDRYDGRRFHAAPCHDFNAEYVSIITQHINDLKRASFKEESLSVYFLFLC